MSSAAISDVRRCVGDRCNLVWRARGRAIRECARQRRGADNLGHCRVRGIPAIARKKHISLALAEDAVREFMADAHIETAAIADIDSGAALNACARYGKGRGHPAQLNMGDCFAYALAKNRGIALLFKGRDSTRTDIAQAVTLQ